MMSEPRVVADDRRRDSDTGRMLAFSDGVFAIAITLLVLEIRAPDVEHGLLDALVDLWPSYLSYVLSFVIIGIIWAQHHSLFQHITRADHTFLLINVGFLMWVAFLPFPTGLLAEYLDNSGERQTATAVYSATFVAGALLFNLLWRYAIHNDRLIDATADRRVMQATTRSYTFGPVLYLIDFGLAFVSVTASLILFLLIALLFAISPYADIHQRVARSGSA
jgi:uncharacterized membrane protein